MQTIEQDRATDQGFNGATRPAVTKGTRGRKAARGNAATGRRALKLSLDNQTIENLNLHALKAGQSVSEYVREMVARHCTHWIIHAKPGPKPEGD